MGGPPQVAVRMASAQVMKGASVTILSSPDGDAANPVRELLTSAHGAGALKRVTCNPPSLLRQITGAGLEPSLDRCIADADIVHIHGVWEPLLYAAGLTARRYATPYVITPHGMLDPWSLSQKRTKKRIALACGYRRFLNRAAFMHGLNSIEIELMAPLGLTCPARIVPNGVFLEEIEPLPAEGEFRSTHPELGDDPYVLFLSRLHYKKGLDYLASTFCELGRRVPNIRLVVAGPDGGAQAAFEEKIRAGGVADRVHVIGPIYGRDKFAAIVDASCFCLPSRQEGFSIAITEALACGCPCIVSEACHFPELAEAKAGVELPLDAARFAEAIEQLLADPRRRASMSAAGRALVSERYTWGAIGSRMLEHYVEVTG